MKQILFTFTIFSFFFASLSKASEEFDPALFPELAAEEFKSDNFDNITTPQVVAGSKMIATPKFVNDEDMNFDDLVDENIQDNGEEIKLEGISATPEKTAIDTNILPTPPPPASTPISTQKIEIPMIQAAPVTAATQPEEPKDTKKIDKDQSLTDTLSEASPEKDSTVKLPGIDTAGTWINKIKTPITGGVAKTNEPNLSLENMVQNAKKTKNRSNASVFDISGAMLRMTFEQIDKILTQRGYKRSLQKLDIPNFIRWRNEDKCRSSGVIGYERIANCVIKIARQDKHEYIETASYTKFDTKEDIEIRFTSNFTNNKAYKISYKSEALNIGGNSPKMMYLRNIKIFDFWKKINQKYGAPDSKDDVMWGLGGNKPYMQAGTGRLILEDPMLRELDYTRMSREDQRFMNTDLYSF